MRNVLDQRVDVERGMAVALRTACPKSSMSPKRISPTRPMSVEAISVSWVWREMHERQLAALPRAAPGGSSRSPRHRARRQDRSRSVRHRWRAAPKAVRRSEQARDWRQRFLDLADRRSRRPTAAQLLRHRRPRARWSAERGHALRRTSLASAVAHGVRRRAARTFLARAFASACFPASDGGLEIARIGLGLVGQQSLTEPVPDRSDAAARDAALLLGLVRGTSVKKIFERTAEQTQRRQRALEPASAAQSRGAGLPESFHAAATCRRPDDRLPPPWPGAQRSVSGKLPRKDFKIRFFPAKSCQPQGPCEPFREPSLRIQSPAH